MAISYVGGLVSGRAGSTVTTTQSLSGTLTGGSNTSPSTGDLVVVMCAAGADTTAISSQAVSGNNSGAYVNLTEQSVLGSTYDSEHIVGYQIQGVTVDTSITIPSSGGSRNAQCWVIHVFRGVDSTTPMDVTATYATGTGTGRPNPAAITPVTAGAWICAFYASAAATGATYTAPTDFATNWRTRNEVDTADCMVGGGYYTGWTSGSYDPAAITAGGTTNAADAWTATTIALRPQSDNYTGTPGVASLTTTRNTPTVSLGINITTEAPSSLTLTAYAPSIGTIVTPGTASLTLTAHTPTVDFTNNYLITTASPTALSLTAQTPTVTATDNKSITLQLASLTLTPYEPTVAVTDNKSIELLTQSLTLTAHAPGVAVSDNSAVTPNTATLSLTAYTPTVDYTSGYTVTPDTATLTLTPYTPIVDATNHIAIITETSSLTTTLYEPTVSVAQNAIITPGTAQLRLTSSYPIVNGQVREPESLYFDTNGNAYYILSHEAGLLERV